MLITLVNVFKCICNFRRRFMNQDRRCSGWQSVRRGNRWHSVGRCQL